MQYKKVWVQVTPQTVYIILYLYPGICDPISSLVVKLIMTLCRSGKPFFKYKIFNWGGGVEVNPI